MPRLGAVAVLVLALGLVMATSASSQSTASAQAGVGTVRFAGGSSTSVLSLSPDYSYAAQNLQLSVGATLATVPKSSGYGQVRFGGWAGTPAIVGRWRLAADAELSGTALAGGAGLGSGSGSITGEAVYLTPRWGAAIGAGPASGWITDSRPVTALHARVRGWWSDPLSSIILNGSIEPTRFLGAWFTDVTGMMQHRRGRFTAQVSAAGRISSTYVSRAAALVTIDYRLSPSWSINAAGGNVLPDPYQGFPATGVLLLGARLQLPLHRSKGTLVVGGNGFAVTHGSDGVTLEFEQRGAQTVAVAGDWNSWLPEPLRPTRPDRWAVQLSLAPGVYHFTLLIDGTAWTIPPGVPSVPDGLGGRVAVLVVTR